MEEHGQAFLLQEGFFLLGTALVFVLLFRRLGLGATLGYLLAGAILGPYALGLIGDAQGKIDFAELGITLLLFIVGLELAPRRLWRMRSEIFGLGFLQVALCGLAISAIIYSFTTFTVQASLALGLPLGLSSTAQVLPMLQSAGRLNSPFGERAFAILLFQDLSIIPLITIIAAMNRNPDLPEGPPGWQLAVMTVLAIVGLVITFCVYGAVALIVKMDDVGLHLARKPSEMAQAVGRFLLKAMPIVLKVLSFVGMLAMLWVGGGIILHGLEELGLPAPAHFAHGVEHAVAQASGALGGVTGWVSYAVVSALLGLVLGTIIALALHMFARDEGGETAH